MKKSPGDPLKYFDSFKKTQSHYFLMDNLLQALSASEQREGIRFFAAILHTHFLGTAVRIHHIRGHRVRQILAYDEHFDARYQTYRRLKQEILVRPVIDVLYNLGNMQIRAKLAANNGFFCIIHIYTPSKEQQKKFAKIGVWEKM